MSTFQIRPYKPLLRAPEEQYADKLFQVDAFPTFKCSSHHLLMKNRCITHYLMRYRLRDQMSEAKWTSNSQSFLEQKIISQLQISQWLQIIWCSCVINCRHSAGVCLLTTTNLYILYQPSAVSRATEHITGALRHRLDGLQLWVKLRGKTAHLCKASPAPAPLHNDPCQLRKTHNYISEEYYPSPQLCQPRTPF